MVRQRQPSESEPGVARAEGIALKIIPPKTKSITQVTTQQKLIVSQKIRDRDTQGLVICEAKTERREPGVARPEGTRPNNPNKKTNYKASH